LTIFIFIRFVSFSHGEKFIRFFSSRVSRIIAGHSHRHWMKATGKKSPQVTTPFIFQNLSFASVHFTRNHDLI